MLQKRLLVIGVAVLFVVSTTRADPKFHPSYTHAPTAETHDKYNEVQYDYRYAVDDPKSGVINDRWEHRYGEYVKGAYSVLDPDGRVRTVDYEVDGPKGFHAVIRTQFPTLIPGQRTDYRSSHKNPVTGAFIASSPDTESVHENNFSPPPSTNPHIYAAPRPDAGHYPQAEGYPVPSQFILPPPLTPNAKSQITEAIPVTSAPSTQFTRTYYGG